MSIVRWGYHGSDLYIYQTTDTEIVCCSCLLMPKESIEAAAYGENWYGFEHESFVCNSIDEMIAHVQAHIEAGHCVWDETIPNLERRRNDAI